MKEWDKAVNLSTYPLVSEDETKVSSIKADVDHYESSADEDSGCEGLLDQGNIMDFSAAAIAEQLTQIDAVSWRMYLNSVHM